MLRSDALSTWERFSSAILGVSAAKHECRSDHRQLCSDFQALYLASKRPKTSTRTVIGLTVIQAAQLVALAVALVDDAQELDAEGELVLPMSSQESIATHVRCLQTQA